MTDHVIDVLHAVLDRPVGSSKWAFYSVYTTRKQAETYATKIVHGRTNWETGIVEIVILEPEEVFVPKEPKEKKP